MKPSVVATSVCLTGLLFAFFVPACAIAAQQAGAPAGQGITISADCGLFTVRPIAEGALRVRCSPRGNTPTPDLILLHSSNTVPSWVRRDKYSISLFTGRMSAKLDLRSMALQFSDAEGRLLLQERPGGRSLRVSSVQGRPTSLAEDSFLSPPDEHLFGSGQFQDGYLDVRDLPRRLTQVNTQIALPFLLSSKGYGLLWHNYGLTEINPADNTVDLMQSGVAPANAQADSVPEGTFEGDISVPSLGRYAFLLDSGRTMAARYFVEIDGKNVLDFSNRWLPPTTSWLLEMKAGKHHVLVKGGAKARPVLHWRASAPQTVLRSPVAEAIDYVVFAGPRLDDVIATYRTLSGQAPLMPIWAYGFIQCRERYSSSAEIIEAARQFRARQLPMDVIVQDWQYWGNYGWNAMQWDERYYPDPATMVRELHELHAKLMVSVWSRIAPESAIGAEFTAKKLYIPHTPWVDFFNPEAAALYWKDIAERMLPLGIDAWWLDAAEPENDALAGRMTTAGPGETVRLLYPLLVSRTVYEGQRKSAPDRRVFILTRSAFLGQQRYASAVWSGDVGSNWETLRRQIRAGLDYSVAGLPYWTTDTGGFFRPGDKQYTDPEYHELFLRWLQFSAFSPLMRVHGFQTHTEPWNFGHTVEEEERQYLDLRYRLLPYIYSQAAQVTFHGFTFMRPLVMDFPSDVKALDQNDEYMFGQAFLVAPVLTSGARTWSVYTPATPGGWYDWWTEKKVQGGRTAMLDAPLEKLPVLVRAGSIVPLAPVTQYAGDKTDGTLELRIYPGADANFTLYEDEGTNYNYEHGAFSEISMHWSQARHALTIADRRGTFSGMAARRKFRVHLAGGPASSDQQVTYDGSKTTVTVIK